MNFEQPTIESIEPEKREPEQVVKQISERINLLKQKEMTGNSRTEVIVQQDREKYLEQVEKDLQELTSGKPGPGEMIQALAELSYHIVTEKDAEEIEQDLEVFEAMREQAAQTMGRANRTIDKTSNLEEQQKQSKIALANQKFAQNAEANIEYQKSLLEDREKIEELIQTGALVPEEVEELKNIFDQTIFELDQMIPEQTKQEAEKNAQAIKQLIAQGLEKGGIRQKILEKYCNGLERLFKLDPEKSTKIKKAVVKSLQIGGAVAAIALLGNVLGDGFGVEDAEAAEAQEGEDAGFFDLQAEHPDIQEHLENKNLAIDELQGLLEEGFEDIYEDKLKIDPKKLSISDILKYVIKDEYGKDFDFSQASPEVQKFINDKNVQEGVGEILEKMKFSRLLFVRRDSNKLVEDFQERTESETSQEQEAEQVQASEQADISQELEAMQEIEDNLSPEYKTKFNSQINELLKEQFNLDENTKKMMGESWRMTFEKYPDSLSGLMDAAGIEIITEENINWETFQKRMRYALEHTDDIEQKTKIEQATAKFLANVLDKKIDNKGAESPYFTIERILDNNSQEANCLGVSQLYELIAKKVGLNVGRVGVWVDDKGKMSSHSANIIKFSNESWQLIDVNYHKFQIYHKTIRAEINGKPVYANIEWDYKNSEQSKITYDQQTVLIKGVEISPLNTEAGIAQTHLSLAEEHRQKKEFNKERALLKKALELDPTSASVHTNIGVNFHDQAWEAMAQHNIKLAKDLFTKSIDNLENAVKFNSEHADAFASLGGSYHSLGDITASDRQKQLYYNKALENYQKAITVNPQKYKNVLQSHINKIQK